MAAKSLRTSKSAIRHSSASRHSQVGPAGAQHRSSAAASTGAYNRLSKNSMMVTGTTIEKNRENVKLDTNQRVVCSASNPISSLGGAVVPKGALAPKGAIVKVADMSEIEFKGAARHFDRNADAVAAIASCAAIASVAAIAGSTVGDTIDDGGAPQAPSDRCQITVRRTYAGQVAPAGDGAAMHPAGKADVVS